MVVGTVITYTEIELSHIETHRYDGTCSYLRVINTNTDVELRLDQASVAKVEDKL